MVLQRGRGQAASDERGEELFAVARGNRRYRTPAELRQHVNPQPRRIAIYRVRFHLATRNLHTLRV